MKNGMSLRKFTFELTNSIYHLKNVFWVRLGAFSFRLEPLDNHPDLKKCQSNTLAGLDAITVAKATLHWLKHSDIFRRGGTEILLRTL